MGHNLWKDGDRGIPEALLDRNGQVVLGMCRICGKAEIELDEECLRDFQDGQWWMLELDTMVKDGTPDQKRAMAVIRNLLRTAHESCNRGL